MQTRTEATHAPHLAAAVSFEMGSCEAEAWTTHLPSPLSLATHSLYPTYVCMHVRTHACRYVCLPRVVCM